MILNFTEEKITDAIRSAQTGIDRYLKIMDLFVKVDVSINRDFQREFNSFYRVRQRKPEWYREYYGFMEGRKGSTPSFDEVLDYLNKFLKRYEPSFSSKLVATLDPNQPIWDKYVLKNTKTREPSYTSRYKIEEAKAAYKSIQKWYKQFLNSSNGKLVINVFNQKVSNHSEITDIKKIDFVLWQTRD